ncbi:hypothetical protein CBS101457_001719 [Exobasidium rhododendri]|nr:hypothetical protein CBS101457_001719 [Exobasidium rhododendri]
MPNAQGSTSSDTASLLDPPRRSNRSNGQSTSSSAYDRRAELAAAFGSDEEDDEDEYLRSADDNGRRVDTRLAIPVSPPPVQSRDVFFDAGDALQSDPLGAFDANQTSDAPPYTHTVGFVTPASNRSDSGPTQQSNSYDFEGASYFTSARPNASRSNSVNVSRAASPGAQSRLNANDGGIGGLNGANGINETSISKMRIALGRFGRFVGMRVPGATYNSLSTEDENSARARSSTRGVMGGGMGQDGVFANMNAKPERRRRVGENGEDRGDDDDLVDDVLPPTYETAAADTAPPYWETTIIGGAGGLHPLAPGGMGWTPGGATVGAIEDLIVEGLPVGNFFGFAWNLLVSMSFQFVGFLLTYLLHTTHAARCGSRAGLGITLVQYGFYLRTRAIQIGEGKLPDDGLSPATGSEDMSTPSPPSAWWANTGKPVMTGEEGKRDWVSRGISFAIRQTLDAVSSAKNITSSANASSTADALALDDNGMTIPSAESMSASTEWLAYILMGIGWFILLSSVLSYWRVHRWGRQLVDAARRDSDRDEAANSTGAAAASTNTQERDQGPVGFLQSLGMAFRNGGPQRQRGHSAEDWVIFPGRHRTTEGTTTDPEAGLIDNDERLLHSMRNVGLLA